MLINIKLLLNIKDNAKDNVLNCLIEQCSNEYLALTHNSTIDEGAVIQMVVFRYSSLGTEELESEGYNGASFSYAKDYPDYLKAQIHARRRVRVI